MDKNDALYQNYVNILHEELVPAMGCTEPIAIAYGCAVAQKELGELAEQVLVEASANIIKNVKSVIIPNTGGLKGIEAAAAVGIIAGKPEKDLEVIAEVDAAQREATSQYLAQGLIKVQLLESSRIFDLVITMRAGHRSVKLQIADRHTNIVFLQLDERILLAIPEGDRTETRKTDRSTLNIQQILEFADTVDLAEVAPVLARQIAFNVALAEAGLREDYGANIGKVLFARYGNDITNRAKAVTAAASDARMGGCPLPAIINSGSGNQGLTVSLPVIEYAKEFGIDDQRLYRALIVANLCTIHQKTGIGPLSAFCGAVCAGCGAGAGVAYLLGGGYPEVAHTIVNAVAIVSGMICDGAKASCAAKVAASVDAGLLGYYMYLEGQQFRGGDGIVTKGVENTIDNVGYLGKVGMRETDKEIIQIMLRPSQQNQSID